MKFKRSFLSHLCTAGQSALEVGESDGLLVSESSRNGRAIQKKSWDGTHNVSKNKPRLPTKVLKSS